MNVPGVPSTRCANGDDLAYAAWNVAHCSGTISIVPVMYTKQHRHYFPFTFHGPQNPEFPAKSCRQPHQVTTRALHFLISVDVDTVSIVKF